MDLRLLAQTLITGTLLGTAYGLIALGLSLTMGVLGIINVAHSTFVVLGALCSFTLLQTLGVDPILSGVLLAPAFFVVGVITEMGLVRKVARLSSAGGMLALFGLMVVIESVMIMIWTTDTRVVTSPFYGDTIFTFGPLRVPAARAAGAALALVAVGLIHFLLVKTSTGRAIRALAQNRDAAEMLGINTSRLSAIVFGIGTSAAALGGISLALSFPFAPQDHLRWLAWAFLIVIIGGLGSVTRTLIAGIAVALVEGIAGSVFPFKYVFFVMYGLLALVLVVRGRGLLGSQERQL